jgi:hypothetical protein
VKDVRNDYVRKIVNAGGRKVWKENSMIWWPESQSGTALEAKLGNPLRVYYPNTDTAQPLKSNLTTITRRF